MAKVTGGLFSLEASGKFANALIFDRRGYVRSYKRPSDPQTEAQGNVRQVMLAAQRAIGVAGGTTRESVRDLAPTGYRWNSYLVQQMIGQNSAQWDAGMTAFNALDAAAQATWTTEAETLSVAETNVAYAGDPAIPAGASLFNLARALFQMGIHTAAGAPAAANAAAWAANIAS